MTVKQRAWQDLGLPGWGLYLLCMTLIFELHSGF